MTTLELIFGSVIICLSMAAVIWAIYRCMNQIKIDKVKKKKPKQ